MARNVQIKGLLVILTVAAALCGCGKKAELVSEYNFNDRAAGFLTCGPDAFSHAFAEDICVLGDTDQAEPVLTADAAGLFSLDGGTAEFQQNAAERMNPASTTKIMTAIVALKNAELSDMVTVPPESVINETGSSMAGIVPGDKIRLEDLLYGLMIPSGNDAANAIAVHVGGSIEDFVEMMNAEAASLGATGTHFANANGLTNEDHYTTAYDLYLMFHEALKFEKFRTIIGTHSYTAEYTDKSGEPKTATWNVGNYYMKGTVDTPEGLTVFGGKTGTTSAAGYCLIMGSRTDDGREYASVVMKADSRNELYEDMTKIISKIGK